jgi:hypothetical protein
MKYILSLVLFAACSPGQFAIFKEAVESELDIAEKIIEQEASLTPKK